MSTDNGREIDWDRTVEDDRRHRPDDPRGISDRLRALGVGRPGQKTLDLGTGTGHLARELAGGGCEVWTLDKAPKMLAAARAAAAGEGLEIRIGEGRAELPFTHESFRGRIRASRGVGATLEGADLGAFDAALAVRLREVAPDPLTIRHRRAAHILWKVCKV